MTDLTPLDTTWLLFSAFLVMTMQIGFCMLEAGLVRQKNSINVAFKNLMDFVIASLVFWAVGYGLMFGASVNGWFGSDLFLVASRDTDAAFLLFQLTFCGAAATIIGGALAERTRFLGYVAITVLTAGLIYPVVGHWVWGGTLGGELTGWLGRLGFIDFAGGSVVHSTGGWMALAGALVVGARLGRFPAPRRAADALLDAGAGPGEPSAAEAPLRPIGGSNYVLATVGVLMLWFGWFGFNGGSALGYDADIGSILINTVLAAASGGLVLVLLAFVRDAKPDIAACLNGTLAGLVAVTAGAHLYETADAVLVGAAGAAVASLATGALARARVDDVIGAFPVHACAGMAGTLLVALLGDPAGFGDGRGPLEQLAVQAIGVGAIALWAFGVGYVTLFLLNALVPLRVSEADERRGLNIAEHDASSDLVALLEDMGSQRASGDFATPLAVEPHTEIGTIAAEYNRVTERVRTEIAEREHALARLRSASQFQFIFENTSEGIVRFALDGRILQANPAAARILGHASPADLVERGGAFLGALDWADGAAFRQMVDRLAAKGAVEGVELDFRRRVDDREGHVRVSVRRVDAREDEGSVDAGAGSEAPAATYLASLTDVSERRANERLSLEVDEAQAASRAKSEFLANMSHEIRTPLNGVTGMLELLARTSLDARQERYVRIAGASAKSLLSVINDILDVSKIEAGKLDLESVEFGLPELLGDVADMFAPQAAGKRLELVARIDPALPTRVTGDPERLRQILVNLLGNAVKFTESGTVSLGARSVGADGDGAPTIELAVQDTGIGIDPADSARLFEPFEQADGSTTRRFGGTGLGLSISRRLADLMDGRIEVESEPGRGTTFRVTLPLAPARTIAPDRGPGLGLEHAGLRVLAVDDHVVNLELLKELLEPEGLVVGRVTNAEAALDELDRAAAEGAPYALVLLDYHMPGTNGYELARRVRERPEHADTRLVMLTSIDQALPAAEREALGIAGNVVKPLRPSRLFDTLGEVLDGAPAAARVAPAAAGTDDLGLDDTLDTGPAATLAGPPGAEPARAGAVARGGDEVPLEDLLADALGGRVPARGARADRASLEGRRALVVEDNAVNQLVTEELVELLGLSAATVDDGRAALERLEDESFDVVLMDVQMPVMDGFEATRAWRAREAELGLPPVPIVAVTANAVVGDRERCLEAGMDDYVTKPIDPEALAEVLVRAMAGGR